MLGSPLKHSLGVKSLDDIWHILPSTGSFVQFPLSTFPLNLAFRKGLKDTITQPYNPCMLSDTTSLYQQANQCNLVEGSGTGLGATLA